MVLSTLAEHLGARDGGPAAVERRIEAALGGRPTLLLLDNFEHVSAAAAEIASILGRCPEATAIVTSRHALRVEGEREYRVPPLDEAEAARLFLARAAALRPPGDPSSPDEEVATEIARRLDGLPLAIELAASALRVYPPRELVARLCDRLDILPRGRPTAAPHQRTLRGAMDWSHDLLEPSERDLFARLAVFTGGWTLAAAEEVCQPADGDGAVTALAGLIDKSLVQPLAGTAAQPRFRMLETVRMYAVEKLHAHPDRPRVESRHTEWVLRLVGGPGVPGRYRPDWLARIDADRSNLREAVRRALRDRDASMVLTLVRATIGYLALRDLESEGLRWIDQALGAADSANPYLRARLLLYGALLHAGLGDYAGLKALLSDARATSSRLDEDPYDRGVDQMVSAAQATAFGTPREALEASIRAAETWKQFGGSEIGEALCWMTAGALAIAIDPGRAEGYINAARELAEAMENDGLRANARAMLGFIARAARRRDEARRQFAEAAAAARRSAQLSSVAYALDGIAAVAIDGGRCRDGVHALAASEVARARAGRAAWSAHRPAIDGLNAAARRAMGPREYDRARTEAATRDPLEILDAGLRVLGGAPTDA